MPIQKAYYSSNISASNLWAKPQHDNLLPLHWFQPGPRKFHFSPVLWQQPSPQFPAPFLPLTLVSCGCHTKCPQPGWLRTIGIYSPTVLEGKSTKSRCQQNHASSKSFRRKCLLTYSGFWWLLASLGLWLKDSNLFMWPSPPCLCLFFFCLFS